MWKFCDFSTSFSIFPPSASPSFCLSPPFLPPSFSSPLIFSPDSCPSLHNINKSDLILPCLEVCFFFKSLPLRSLESKQGIINPKQGTQWYFWDFYAVTLVCVCACTLSHVWFFAAPWTIACQAPLSMEFFQPGFWSGLPFSTPGDLPNSGIDLTSLTSPALRGEFFTTAPLGKLPGILGTLKKQALSQKMVSVHGHEVWLAPTISVGPQFPIKLKNQGAC